MCKLRLFSAVVYLILLVTAAGCIVPTRVVPKPEAAPLSRCVTFDDDPSLIGATFKVPDTFDASGAIFHVLPFQWRDGTWTKEGYGARVQNTQEAGGSGNEIFINNVNIGFIVGEYHSISMRFHDLGGNVNLVINGQVGNYDDFEPVTLGGVDVQVVYDAPDSNSGVLTLSGEFENFMFQEVAEISLALGGQELAIDNICPTDMFPQTPEPEGLGREAAAQLVIDSVLPDVLEHADPHLGLRVNQFRELVAQESEIRSASTTADRLQVLICKNPCWLFMIDKDPLAHFAHPVEILAIDTMTKEISRMEAEWWPEVNGRPVFDKLDDRTNPEQIILYREPVKNLLPGHDLPADMTVIVEGACPVSASCETWAVIVCGYDDLPDSFDEDTDGIYTVLHNMGVPDDHIFFVSPHTTHDGVDRETSRANVEWAINQVAALSSLDDQVLFFYRSHGGVDTLSCVPGSPGGGSISAAELDNWLDGITSESLSIVIEACHSGSLIGRYEDGTYVAGEDDLAGEGETNRFIFTSASSDTSSYGDLDGPGDPNPGDAGSETVWGYVEAFITAAADSNLDEDLSVEEARQYAMDNDYSLILGSNVPQFTSTGRDEVNTYNYCKCGLPAENLLRNPKASLGGDFWSIHGNTAIESIGGNPAFTVRNKGYFIQDVPIPPDAIGKQLLMIGRVSSERINSNGSITGLPYLYGYIMEDDSHILTYLQGQNMRSTATVPNQWAAAWGIFEIPPSATRVRFFLQQAERSGDPQNGSAARFDDLGLYIINDQGSATQLATQYIQIYFP